MFEFISKYFEHILVLAFFVSLVSYIIHKVYIRKKPEEQQKKRVNASIVYLGSFFWVLFLVLMVRSFVMEPFRIPSGSMIPSLLVKDFLVVSKYSYGVKLPITHDTIINVSKPKRGDVVVFRYPLDESQNYIKRVIGLPGDRIQYQNNVLTINGKRMPVSNPEYSSYIDVSGRLHNVTILQEDLDGVKHNMQVDHNRRSIDVDIRVPEGHYFMMGDNRDNSNDSRSWGPVPEENLVGKAQFIWLHWGFKGLNRIGNKIK